MPSAESDNLTSRVASIVEQLRPSIQADLGDIELVDVTDAGVVRIRFHGECVNCPSKPMTLQHDIEKNIKANVPEITAVEAVE